MKKVAILSVAVFAFAFAFAASASSDVVITLNSTQNADVVNSVTVTGNTGGNTQDAAQDLNGGASILTGAADTASEISNFLNLAGSEVNVQNAADVTVDSDVVQDGHATNVATVTSDTGDNLQEASQDIAGASSINTGAASSLSSILNGGSFASGGFFNTAFALFNIGDEEPACGCESVVSDVVLDHDVAQDADVVNTAILDADTGENTQDAGQDLGGGCDCDGDGPSIITGASTAGSLIENWLNRSETMGTIGAGSDISVTVYDDQDAETKPLTNSATVSSDTGDNLQEADQDVTGSSTDTGDQIGLSSIFNQLNERLASFFIN